VLTPEGPAGRAIRQAILDDESDSGLDDTASVVAAGVGEVFHVGVEVFATSGAVMLRIEQDDVAGSAGEGIAEVVEGAACDAIAVGAMGASRAGPPTIIAALTGDLGFGQVADMSGALGGIGAIFAGWGHEWRPGRGIYQELRDSMAFCSSNSPGNRAIVSETTCHSSDTPRSIAPI
jgi:hypothetical protein